MIMRSKVIPWLGDRRLADRIVSLRNRGPDASSAIFLLD
jgi:hypothetical protein